MYIGVDYKQPYAVYDDFTRANSATNLGMTNTGETWVQRLGVWGITNNMAYLSTAAPPSIATIDKGMSDCLVSVKIAVYGGDYAPGIIVRYTDNYNYIRLTWNGSISKFILQKRVAGVLSANLLEVAHVATDGDVVGLLLNDDNISIVINGVTKASVIEAFNKLATSHGMGTGSAASTLRWDNFIIVALQS